MLRKASTESCCIYIYIVSPHFFDKPIFSNLSPLFPLLSFPIFPTNIAPPRFPLAGATKGNSGIVHAGYDDTPGTTKAKYCWKGNQMFPQLDRELHFGFQQNGSLVVAKSEEDMQLLQQLMKRGDINQVENLQILNQQELREKEPWIHDDAIGALYSPDAGTITPYEYTIALAENAVDNGVELKIRRRVTKIQLMDMTKPMPKNQTNDQNDQNNGDEDEDETVMYPKARFMITVEHWEPEETAKRLNMEMAAASSTQGIGPTTIGVSLLVVASSLYVARYQSNNDQLFYICILSCTTCMVYGLMSLLGMVGTAATAASTAAATAASTLLFKPHTYEPSKNTILTGLSATEIYWCNYIVNSAGTKSDQVAKMVGDDSFLVKPRMGEYILLHKDEGIKTTHTLFPCPHPIYGKGVLVQNTLWGNLILGPTARDTMKKEGHAYVLNKDVQNESRDNIMGYILSKCRNLIPSFDASRVIHTFSGARAKNTTGDWIIGPVPNVPGFINAASIDSPGIAASPAIAADVVKMLHEEGLIRSVNTTFNPNRAPLVMPKNGPYLAVNDPVTGKKRTLKYDGKNTGKNEKNPSTNVICKCEKVTEAEIIVACHRSLPIDSTQALRKRVRCGMGHCQGDPKNYDCEGRAAAIIARETGLPLNGELFGACFLLGVFFF